MKNTKRRRKSSSFRNVQAWHDVMYGAYLKSATRGQKSILKNMYVEC